MDCYHITIAADDRANAFPDTRARRRAVRLLARVGTPSLALFCVVDDHVHLVTAAGRARSGRLAQAVGAALTHAFPRTTFDGARIRPVEDRRHCLSLVRYVFRQTEHHGLAGHPAGWEGSCFMDLVGARVCGFSRAPLAHLLPRLAAADLWRAADLSGTVSPATDDELAARGPAAIARAARAAVAAAGGPGSKRPEDVAAKRIAVHLYRRAEWPTRRIAGELSLARSSVNRLASERPPDTHIRAARLQLRLAALLTPVT